MPAPKNTKHAVKHAKRKAAPKAKPRTVSAPMPTTCEAKPTPAGWVDNYASGFEAWVDTMSVRLMHIATTASLRVPGSSAVTPLFISEPLDLFAIYMRNLPREARQYHNCNECRKFINRYGRLLYVDLAGNLRSAIWRPGDAPAFYAKACAAMETAVIDAGIRSPFYDEAREWGTRRSPDGWTHFAVRPFPSQVATPLPLKTCEQRMAEKMEDFKNVDRAIREFSVKTLDLAVSLLKSDVLYRSEKVLAPAEWLHDLKHDRMNRNARNRLWVKVAQAPAGFCHPRASMIGSLLEDLETKSVEAARRAFAAKMNPLAYQRPTAAPAEQTIDRAEEIVEKLGIRPSLMRRLAALTDIPAYAKIWNARDFQPALRGGAFDVLRNVGQHDTTTLQPEPMSWTKFQRTVLPVATEIKAYIPAVGNFTVLCTAADAAAPPIIRWDEPHARNPFNWYVWHGGSPAKQHCLQHGSWVEVDCITDRPCVWTNACQDHGFPPSRLFFLKGAAETLTSGSALFPECIRAELHGVRSVIEKFSKTFNMPTRAAAAVALPCGDKMKLMVRVTTGVLVRTIIIDRME